MNPVGIAPAKPGRASSPVATRSWWAALSPEKRRAILELSRVRRARTLVAPLFLGLWAVAGIVVMRFPTWPVRLPAYVVAGIALHALGILLHEAVHGNFFRHRVLDRWAAFLLGAPTLVSAEAYRVTHLLHHRYNRGAKDPDELGNYLADRRLLSLAFYGWVVLGMLAFVLHVPIAALRRGTRGDRIRVIGQYLLLAALYAGVIRVAASIDALDVLVHGWLIPLGVVWLLVNLRGWSEHLLTEPGHPLTETRTVTSNALVRAALCNLNYHLEHHLFPAVPWYNLPRVHRLLRDEFHAAGASIYRSYSRFFWDALRAGIHGRAPAVAPNATPRPHAVWATRGGERG